MAPACLLRERVCHAALCMAYTYCALLACMSFCQSSSNFSTICSLIWLRDWWVVYEPVTASSSSSSSSSWSLWILVSCWWVEGVIRRVIRHHPVAGWPTAPRYGHQIVSDIWRSTWRRFFFTANQLFPFLQILPHHYTIKADIHNTAFVDSVKCSSDF